MYRDYVVYDFETTNKNPHKCQATQLAALALDPRTFRVKGSFNSEIWAEMDDEKAVALGFDPTAEEALIKTRKTREQISAAPPIRGVWDKFCNFVKKYNWKGTPFFAPIRCGYNIIQFDDIILNRIASVLGPYDNDYKRNTLFNSAFKFDLMDNVWAWTEGDPTVKSISMDNLRKRMLMKSDNAHDALQDVKDTANIMIKFMKTHRAVYRNLELEKAFADGLYVL